MKLVHWFHHPRVVLTLLPPLIEGGPNYPSYLYSMPVVITIDAF